MTYQVSKGMKGKFSALLAMPQVQESLNYIKANHSCSIDEQIEFALIEAPTFQEKNRADHLRDKLCEIGVENVCIDEHNNVEGMIKGTEAGLVLTEAHIDTVFPFGTTSAVRREGDMLYAPGIYDNARGIACMLQAIRALKRSGIKTRKSLIVGGTSREEAEGGLGGMRDLLDRHGEIEASISVDGGFLECITFNATYNRVLEYTFRGTGGHAFSAFGVVANPVGAACRAVVKIENIMVPGEPKTTYAAAKIVSAEHSGVTAIPDNCRLYVNYRSDSKEEFERLSLKIAECIQTACCEETARWGRDTITAEERVLTDLPGGHQDVHSQIVEADYICSEYAAGEPIFRASGNSNSNIPISKGIPAVTVGSSNGNNKAHTIDERFCITNAYQCPQGLFLLLLMILGVDGGITSCLTLE